MKRLLFMVCCLLLTSLVSPALATIDWCGNAWPLAFSVQPDNMDLQIYLQVYKAGVTDGAGQGADITVEMPYQAGTYSGTIAMTYNGDIGNNDEYTGVIPVSSMSGVGSVVIYGFDVVDLTDGTSYPGPFPDQNGVSPLIYVIVEALDNDVDVTFTLCMSGESHDSAPFLVGSEPVLGSWCNDGNLPVQMSQVDGDLYTATVTFPAGSNPSFNYKYQKVQCDQWESIGDRSATLPNDGTTEVTLQNDSWNDLPMGCGLGDYLREDKLVTFYVCLFDVETTGDVCIAGNIPELGDWTGVPMVRYSDEMWYHTLFFEAGTPIPLNLEYKFLKDDCGTWESLDNRVLVIDNSLASSAVADHVWDETTGVCLPVPTEETSWGALKSLYR